MGHYSKFYLKSKAERQAILEADHRYAAALDQNIDDQTLESLSENVITSFDLPLAVATGFRIDGSDCLLPMVCEEASVVAAASKGASIFGPYGGFKTVSVSRIMQGQIVLKDQSFPELSASLIRDLIHAGESAVPSLIRRGGKIVRIGLSRFSPYESLDVYVDTQEAMGANLLNTLLEAMSLVLREEYHLDILMSILSNYPEECRVSVQCSMPIEQLDGQWKRAERIVDACAYANLDVHRCATHNKGIMNGIDALVMASGNDWRAVNAAIYTHASSTGTMKSLTSWQIADDRLKGVIDLVLPLGSVSRSMMIRPKVQLAHTIMRHPDAKTLMSYCGALGLAQNFAALNALVSKGIQDGHMKLQAKVIAQSFNLSELQQKDLIDYLNEKKEYSKQAAEEYLLSIKDKKDK